MRLSLTSYHRAQSKPDAAAIARIKVLAAEIVSATTEAEELQEKSSKIEQAIQALEKKILDVGGAKLLTQKSKVDGIRLHINLANDVITKAEVAKAKAEKDTVKLQHTLETSTNSLQEVEREIADLDDQLEECGQYVAKLRTKVDAAQTAAENSKDDLEALKAELDAKTEEIQAFRQKEVRPPLIPTVMEGSHWARRWNCSSCTMTPRRKPLTTRKRLTTGEPNTMLLDLRKSSESGRLYEILAVINTFLSDDEDEEATNPVDNAKPEGDEVKVKAEIDEVPVPKAGQARERTPSHELHMYTQEELSRFRKKELVADAELLDGVSRSSFYERSLTTLPRKAQACET
jgi:structural maintenance of chromosome 4